MTAGSTVHPVPFHPPIEPIIGPTFLRITDDFVGRIDLTDLGFGVSAIGIAVRMVLKHQLPVSLLDRVVGGVARNPSTGRSRFVPWRRL